MHDATASQVRRHEKNLKKKKRFRLCSQLPEAFVKTKEVHAKFAAEGRLQSRHTHTSGRERSFFSERTWWGVWKNRKRSSVSVCPQIQCEPHLLTERGAGFETVWLQRSNHFLPPISLGYSLHVCLFPLCCTHRPNSAQQDSFPASLWIPISRTKDVIMLL